MKKIAFIGVGGAIGTLLRYGVYLLFQENSFPIYTVLVNVLGSLALGFLTGWLYRKKQSPLYAGLGAGMCGGFTTMSTFAADAFALAAEGKTIPFLLYSGGTLIGGLFFAFVGLIAGERLSAKGGAS